MNKRIQELADRAGEYADFESGICTDEFLEKFAEMIVRECMGICDEVQTQYGQYTFTATTCKNRFKQHFGVE